MLRKAAAVQQQQQQPAARQRHLGRRRLRGRRQEAAARPKGTSQPCQNRPASQLPPTRRTRRRLQQQRACQTATQEQSGSTNACAWGYTERCVTPLPSGRVITPLPSGVRVAMLPVPKSLPAVGQHCRLHGSEPPPQRRCQRQPHSCEGSRCTRHSRDAQVQLGVKHLQVGTRAVSWGSHVRLCPHVSSCSLVLHTTCCSEQAFRLPPPPPTHTAGGSTAPTWNAAAPSESPRRCRTVSTTTLLSYLAWRPTTVNISSLAGRLTCATAGSKPTQRVAADGHSWRRPPRLWGRRLALCIGYLDTCIAHCHAVHARHRACTRSCVAVLHPATHGVADQLAADLSQGDAAGVRPRHHQRHAGQRDRRHRQQRPPRPQTPQQMPTGQQLAGGDHHRGVGIERGQEGGFAGEALQLLSHHNRAQEVEQAGHHLRRQQGTGSTAGWSPLAQAAGHGKHSRRVITTCAAPGTVDRRAG